MEDIAESPILLIGDINARTGNSNDYTIRNKHEISNYLLQDNHPRIDRKNCDTVINQEGIKILDFCKSFDLMILNGRTKEDFWATLHITKNKGASSVDLAIISCKIFENVKRCMVLPQLDISDHCKIVTQI